MGKHDYAFQERDPEVGSANDFVELLWRSLSELDYARAPKRPTAGTVYWRYFIGVIQRDNGQENGN